MPTNVCTPFFKPGQNVTGYPTADIAGKTLVMPVDGGRGGLPSVATATAGAPCLGVAGRDVAAAEELHVNVGGIVPVLAGADIVAGTLLMSNATGRVVPYAVATAPAHNSIVGYATASGANGTAVPVKLYG